MQQSGSGGASSTDTTDTTITTGTSVMDLREGDEVIYTAKDGTQIPCIVLYDSTGEYGIQIVTKDVVGGPIEVGPYGLASEVSDSEKYASAKEAYNTIVATFNKEAQKYLNTDLSPNNGARCVGTNPAIQPVTEETDSGTFTSSYAKYQSYDNQFKAGDISATWGTETDKITDWVQMRKSHINCRNALANYFLGTRMVTEDNSMLAFKSVYVYVGTYLMVANDTFVSIGDGGRFIWTLLLP